MGVTCTRSLFPSPLKARIQAETNDAKNALEAYIYSLRNSLHDSLAPYMREEPRAALLEQLEQLEVGCATLCRALHVLAFMHLAAVSAATHPVVFDWGRACPVMRSPIPNATLCRTGCMRRGRMR